MSGKGHNPSNLSSVEEHRGRSFPMLLIKIAIIFFPRVMTLEGGKREEVEEGAV